MSAFPSVPCRLPGVTTDDRERNDEIRRIWLEELEQADELEIRMPGGLDFQVRRSGHDPHVAILRGDLDDQERDDHAFRRIRDTLRQLIPDVA